MPIPVVPRSQIRRYPGQGGVFLRGLASGAGAEEIEAFERRAARFAGASSAVSYASCRSACRALLDALGYPPGSVIAMPSLNYPAIPRLVLDMGFKILWTPVRESDLGPDFGALPGAAVKDVAALIWPHYFGIPAPVDELQAFCAATGADLIEDCAHAIGAEYRGAVCGSFGRAAFTSFETSKMCNTYGGGMVFTSDEDIARRMAERRDMLPPKKVSRILKGAMKSFVEGFATNRWVYTFCVYPLLRRAKIAGVEDFLEEGLHGPAAGEVERYSGAQALVGMGRFDRLKAEAPLLRARFAALQNCLDEAGLGLRISENSAPNGYMTVGLSERAPEISAAFYRRGIDVKMRYMLDCHELGAGEGGDRCAPVARKLFHVPNPVGVSDAQFRKYLAEVRNIAMGFAGKTSPRAGSDG